MTASTRLLLVEPDESDRLLIRRALRGRMPRFTLSTASDSQEVRERLSDGGYAGALIALDGWRQPFEAFDLVRELAPNLPLVALSRRDAAPDALQRGAAGFALKSDPDLAHLHATISAALKQPDDPTRPARSPQEDRYRLMLDIVQDAVLVCDSDGKIVQANLAAERLLAHSMPELIGKPVRRWLAAASGDMPPLASLAGPHPIRLMLRKPPAPVEVRVKTLALDEQPAYVIAMRDLRREERASQLLRAFTAAAAAMQGALTPLDVFRAAGEQLRSTGLVLTVFRLVEDGSALVVWYTELASRVIEYAHRVTGFDPLTYPVPVADAPILQSILASDSPQILLDCVEVIREMLAARLKKLAAPIQKVMGYTEQLGLRLSLEGRVYGLMMMGYTTGQLAPEDQPLLEAFAAQIQAALERARRFETTQSRLAARLQELTRLAQVGEQMQVRLPLDTLLDTIGSAVREVLGWEQIWIWLRDERLRTLRPAWAGAAAANAGAPHLEEPVWCQREYRVGRCYFIPRSQAAFDWQTTDLLVIPLMIGEQMLGAIQAGRLSDGVRPVADDLVSLELFASQSAVAIENALLFERASLQLKQRTDELNALTALSDVMDQDYLNVTLERALDQVLAVSGLDAAVITLLDPPTGELRPAAQRGLSDALWAAMHTRVVYIGEGVAGQALMTGRVLTLANAASDPRTLFRDQVVQEGFQMVTGIGLIGRNPIGALALLARSSKPLSDETQAWLSVAGRQIALSVENTRLLEATRRRQRMAEAIREVNAAVASSLELDGLLSTILDQIGRVVPCDTASILLVEGDVLRIIAVHGLDDPLPALGYAFPRNVHHPAWQAVFSRQVQVLADVTAFEAWDHTPLFNVRSWICAPLIVHDDVIGLLTLDNRKPGCYSEEDGSNVALIAQQAAAAIDIARRFQMERDRSGRLVLLSDLGRELSTALDRDTILGLVVERIVGRFGYAQADVFEIDQVTNELIWSHHAGSRLGDIRADSQRRPMGVGIVGRVAQTGQTYLSGDVSRDPYYVNPQGLSTRSEMTIPVRIEDRLVCVLNVESDQLNAFDADDVAMLETLAGQVGAALSVTVLYREAQQRAGRLSTLFAASHELSSSLDADQVLGRLAQWLVGSADATSARVHAWDVQLGTDRLVAQYVGGRASAIERQSMVGATQPLSELPELVAQMQLRQTAVYTPQTTLIDDLLRETLRTYGVASALYLPLIVRERLIGCVEIWETGHARSWPPDEIYMCQTVANVAAGAIDNARLFAAERQRRAVAETMRELAAVVGSSLELQPILEALLDRAAELIPYDSASVLIAEKDGLRVAAGRGLPDSYQGGQTRVPPTPAIGQILQTQQAQIQADVRGVTGWVWLPGLESVRGWLGAPLKSKGRVVGVIAFDSHTPERYRREHADIAQTIAYHASVAIENARLYQETRLHLRELETLQVVSLEVIQSLDVARVAQAIVEGALRLLNATAVHLFSFDADHDVLEPVASSAAPGFEEVGKPTPRREGLTMQVARSGQALVINDPYDDPTHASVIQAWPGQVYAVVSLPLRFRGRVLGVMNVLFHTPHVIGDEDARVLGLMADQAATALENARLFEAEQQRRIAADVLREMSAVLTSTLKLDEVFERLFDQLARVVPYTSASVLLLEPADRMRIVAGRGFDYPAQIIGKTLDLHDAFWSTQVIRERKPIRVADAQKDENWQILPGMEKIHGWMGAPLMARNEIIGTLAVDHVQPGIYRQEQADVFGVIANQAAAAIANAQLFQAEQRRARQLALVNRVGLDVTSILDVDHLAQTVVEEIHTAFGYYLVQVMLVEGEMLVCRGGAGGDVSGWSPIGLRQPMHTGIIGAAASSREVVWAPDVRSDRRFTTVAEVQHTQSEVALPLMAKGTTIGVLDVQSDRLDAFSAEDREVLRALASQLSAAVENAQLYQALARHAVTLETRVAERTAEIRREQERTITILNSVADAVLVTNLTGAIVLTNPVADTLLHEDSLSAEPGHLRHWLRELTPDQVAAKIDVNRRTLQAAVAYINEENWPVGHVIVLRDITRLEEVDRLKTQFVTTVSHELRTPLTNIKLYLGLFQRGKPEKREQYLATLDAEVNRLERLIADLLDLSRLERGERTVTRETIDLVDVLRHVVSTLEPQAEAKRQALRLETERASIKLLADRNQMIQVFVNLTANAINYTPAGGTIMLNASTVERDGRSWAVVSVSDTGVGISAEDRAHIFDRFYRGQAEQFHTGGTGLGLSIVQEIVNQHAGQILVESQAGQGSRFTVWLPRG